MIRQAFVVLALLGLAASTAEAKTWRVNCTGFHFVRTHFTPAQVSVTGLGVRNANTTGAVTIERLVIRDTFGNVLSDSGPAGAAPHPLNTDYPDGSPGRDITTVPPQENRAIRTLHFPWGLGPVPGPTGAGNFLQIEVELSIVQGGKPDLVAIGISRSVRDRLVNAVGTFVEAAEHARDSSGCLAID